MILIIHPFLELLFIPIGLSGLIPLIGYALDFNQRPKTFKNGLKGALPALTTMLIAYYAIKALILL